MPQNFKKVEDPQLKEIIGVCISSTKEDRPTVKDLLLHEFFQEDLGLKVEFVNKEESIQSTSTKVELWLRLLDPKKRQEKHKENEAIQFEFDTAVDTCDEVSQAMAKNNIILDEDIRTVAMLVRNQISYLTREKTRYQNKLAEQEQNINRAAQQTTPQVPCNNQQPVQLPTTYQYQNTSNQQQSEQTNTQQKVCQEAYQQQLYHSQMQQMQMQQMMQLNQQISSVSQQAQYGTQSFETADYQVHQMHLQVSQQLQDTPSQTMTHQQILPQQVQVHTQQHSLPSHVTQNMSVSTSTAPQLLNQQIFNTSHQTPSSNESMCSQYQTPTQSFSQYQQVSNLTNQVSTPRYTTQLPAANIQPALTPDSSNISPDQFQNHNQVPQSIQQLPLQNATSSTTNQQPSPGITSQQNFIQGMQNISTSQQNYVQVQSPQRVLPSQPCQTSMSNANAAQMLSNNQTVLLNQVQSQKSPQRVLSPQQSHPTNLPLAYLQNTSDSNQINNVNPPSNWPLPSQQMQISQSPHISQPQFQDSLPNYSSQYLPYQEVHLHTPNQPYGVQESQPLVQQMSGSNVSVPSKLMNMTVTEVCIDPTQASLEQASNFNQINQDILPRQASFESESFIGTPDEKILPPSMTTSITSECPSAGNTFAFS